MYRWLLAFSLFTSSHGMAASSSLPDEAWRTELNEDVVQLVSEIKERISVIERIQKKVEQLDSRIEALEAADEPIDPQRLKELRRDRLRLAELHGAIRVNAEQALAIVEAYSLQLAEIMEKTDG